MVKLIKYEFMLRGKRILVFFAAVLFLIIALNLYLRFGTNYIETTRLGISLTLLIILFVTSFGLLFIDILTAYSRELNHKEGYMLFLTPRNGWQIIGGKLLSGLLEGIVFLLYFLLLLYIELFIVYGNASHNLILKYLEQLFYFDQQQQLASVIAFFLFSLMLIVCIINGVVTAYAAMTVRRGFFAHNKFGPIITAVVYIAVSFIVGRLVTAGMNLFPLPSIFNLLYIDDRTAFFHVLNQVLVIYTLFLAVATTIIFAVAGYILEKKIDL
ncbi:MAG: hypothetical protein LBH21_00020 [Gracilibacteraceae bacterium]|nr:hypothetical protein [Gracilibacteraceae bacterium]